MTQTLRFTGQPEADAGEPASCLHVSLSRIEANTKAVLDLVSRGREKNPPLLCGVVKKNAYGLGAEQVAHRMIMAGCKMLAVWSPQEAEHLITKAIVEPILVLMPVSHISRTDVLYRHAVAGKLHLAVHDRAQLESLDDVSRTFGMHLPAHLYLDTGMSRGGFNAEQFVELMNDLDRFQHVRIAGVYTHLATAEGKPDFAYTQLDQFESLISEHGGKLPDDVVLHVSNSFALLRDTRYHQHMVRPGLLLYGYAQPLMAEGPELDDLPRCLPVARWTTRLIHVQHYPRRTPVGYGSTKKLQRPSWLGLAPVGYADGYPLALTNKGVTRVFTRQGDLLGQADVVGKINMDQLVVDLTDLLEADEQLEPASLKGATLELYSDDPEAPNAVDKLAGLIKSHPYELLCRVHPVVPRKYDYR